MAQLPIRLRMCVVVAAGVVCQGGCTGQEPASRSAGIAADAQAACPNSPQAGMCPATRAQAIRLLPPTGEIHLVGLSQEAEPPLPPISGPRLTTSPPAPDASTPARTRTGPRLLRLPPVDTPQEPPLPRTAEPADPRTNGSAAVVIPRLPDGSAGSSPWVWRSRPAPQAGETAVDEHPAGDMPTALPDRDMSALPVRLPLPTLEPAEPVQGEASMQGTESIEVSSLPVMAEPMAGALGRAEAALVRGRHLAERNAHYSARAEFTQALRIVAQTMDSQEGQPVHVPALTSGLGDARGAGFRAP